MEILLVKSKTALIKTDCNSLWVFSLRFTPCANPGPVVLVLTANEIKPGTHSPTLLANAQEILPLPAESVLLSLHTPGLQFPLTAFQLQCMCMCYMYVCV